MKPALCCLMMMGLVTSLAGVGAGNGAIALEPTEIHNRLQAIPTFTVTDLQGDLLITQVQYYGYVGVFFDPAGAIAFRDQAVEENADLAGQVKVTPIALSQIYQLERQFAVGAATEHDPVNFVYLPAVKQVEFAQRLRSDIRVYDVPLFAVKVQSNRDDQPPRYLTIPHKVGHPAAEDVMMQEIVPFYFAQEQAQELMAQYNQALAGQESDRRAVLEVHTLATVLHHWEEDSASALAQIWLIPAPAALDYLQSTP